MSMTAPRIVAAPLPPAERWAVRVLSFGIWAMLAASVVYWVLRSPMQHATAQAAVVATPPVSDPHAVARLLGQAAADAPDTQATAPALASRLRLHGVAAELDGAGVALLALDGQPAKPYRTGQKVVDGWSLQSVAARSAVLGIAGGRSETILFSAAPSSADATELAGMPANNLPSSPKGLPEVVPVAPQGSPPMLPAKALGAHMSPGLRPAAAPSTFGAPAAGLPPSLAASGSG